MKNLNKKIGVALIAAALLAVFEIQDSGTIHWRRRSQGGAGQIF
jgi:hypothetical protein